MDMVDFISLNLSRFQRVTDWALAGDAPLDYRAISSFAYTVSRCHKGSWKVRDGHVRIT